MQNFNNTKLALFSIITITLTLGLAISFQSLLASWTAPTTAPPGGNTYKPLYATSSENQFIDFTTADKGLAIGGNFAVGGTTGFSGDVGVDSDLYVYNDLILYEKFISIGTSTFWDNVGIGTGEPKYKLHITDGSSFFNTETNTHPLIISRLNTSGESQAMQIGVNDGTAVFNYINDEANSRINFRLKNTDTETGGGANANDNTILTIVGNNSGGAVGIGDISPNSDLKLDVNGKIGANFYCDEFGTNCKTVMDFLPDTCSDGQTLKYSSINGWECTDYYVPPACVPDCTGKTCGNDGCGGSCGPACLAGTMCVEGNCVCIPDCVGKECGDDGCGGICDYCPATDNCVGTVCVDKCEGVTCTAPDVCVLGVCVCQPNCFLSCGPNGCGGYCSCPDDPDWSCLTNGTCYYDSGIPSGDCAFAYSYDGQNYNPEFAISNFAVHKAFEYTSYGIMDKLKKVDNAYHVGVYELVAENQYIDQMELLKVRHPKNSWAIPEQNGTINIINEKIYPNEALNKGVSYLSEISASDENYWVTDVSKIDLKNPPMWDHLDLSFKNLKNDKVKFVLRAKDSKLLTYYWKQMVTLIEGGVTDYNILNNDEELFAKVAKWVEKNGLMYIYQKDENGEYQLVNTLMFGNGSFYHTFSMTLEPVNGKIDLRIAEAPYALQIDEVYVDDTPNTEYTVEVLPISKIGENNIKLTKKEIKEKLTMSDEDYLKIPYLDYLHIYFNDTSDNNQNTTFIIKTKAYSETYGFKEDAKDEFNALIPRQDLDLAKEILRSSSGLERKMFTKFFYENIAPLKTTIPVLKTIPANNPLGNLDYSF